MVDTWFSSTVQLGLVSEADFRSNLPQHFNYGLNAKITFDDNHVNVIAGDQILTSPFDRSTFPQEVMITSKEQLEDMKRQMLDFPSFMPYHLANTRSCCGTTDFIIFINPKHPKVKGQLEQSFDRCMKLFTKSKPFAMEIRFDKAVRAQWKRTFRKLHLAVPNNPMYISVTNTGQRCQEFHHARIWFFCLPCALLCVLPYCLCRACTKDFKCEMSADLEYVTRPDENRNLAFTQQYQIAHVTVRTFDPSFSSIEQESTTTRHENQPKLSPSTEAPEQPRHDPYEGYRSPALTEYTSSYITSVRDPYEGYKARE